MVCRIINGPAWNPNDVNFAAQSLNHGMPHVRLLAAEHNTIEALQAAIIAASVVKDVDSDSTVQGKLIK